MPESYKTILKEGMAEITQKKSRFIACAFPISSEEEALAFIEVTRKKHWDASHNCYAYQFGERNQIQRQSDDGEPGGTAGIPILDVLRHDDIHNACIIVTRYFGGTLLGTGGLIRSYGGAAKEALINAQPIEMIFSRVLRVTVDYSLSGKVQYMLLQNGHKIADTVYSAQVDYIVNTVDSEADSLIAKLTDLSSAAAETEILKKCYLPLSEVRA